MKVLVTAASKYGATGEIAEAIGTVLSREGLDVSVVPPEKVASILEYEAVILGSAVYAGHWLKPAVELAERSAEFLAQRPVWLFSSGPIGEPPKPEGDPVDVAKMMEQTNARDHRVFGGKLVKKQLSFGERAMVIAFRAPEGDFRDWDGIQSWASGIAEDLHSGS